MVDLDEEWKRFDPDGHYVRRWLPVLSQLPAQYMHQPWKAPPEVLEEAGGCKGGFKQRGLNPLGTGVHMVVDVDAAAGACV
jgi:hypothetical protein